MKRILCLLTAILMLLGLCACGNTAGTNNPDTEPAVTQSPEEAAVFKILMIGQSHAQDSVWLLYDVLKAHMPDQEFLVVDVYQSISISEHVENIKNNAAVYDYCANNSGKVEITSNYTIKAALKQEQWDLIMFNEATWPQIEDDSFTNGDIQWLTDYIRETAAPGFKLAYNATWAQPITAEVYALNRRQQPDGFRDRIVNRFNGDRLANFDRICEVITKYVETDEDYDFVFHSGTAIQYASETAGVPEGDPMRVMDLYRDYTHLSDYGRLIVAYLIYAQIYGLEEITEVKVDVIPTHMRATEWEKPFGDLEITEEHKQKLMDSVNYALKNPNVAPPQTARPSATLEPLPF